ncbi:MAG TPA: [acyl-carrier-protein] S-malonyltransferase [Actinobacteria bacterium]|nr:[acyl-carrier-protein] S-malonyltransferase [Actinomycetota bacterium]
MAEPYAVLFPGQGSQAVGMGAEVRAARPDLLGRRADEILGWSLERLLAEGPEEELTATDRAQPALYAVSYALWEEFAAAVPHPPAAAAGHSLGEYTALAAAGAVTYEDGLRLVAERGRAMAEAAARRPSSMAALVGVDLEAATAIVEARRAEGGELWVANVNAPGQIVVGGPIEEIDRLVAEGRALGIRRVVPLKVAGAFHTPLMEPAAARLAGVLADVAFAEPRFPVYANVSGRPMEEPRALLVDQLTSPVRFLDTLAAMADAGIRTFVHVGPGDVTAGLARRSVEGATTLVVSDLSDIPDAVAALSVQ